MNDLLAAVGTVWLGLALGHLLRRLWIGDLLAKVRVGFVTERRFTLHRSDVRREFERSVS